MKKIWQIWILIIAVPVLIIAFFMVNKCQVPGCCSFSTDGTSRYCVTHKCSWNRECPNRRTSEKYCDYHEAEQQRLVEEAEQQLKETQEYLRELHYESLRKMNQEQEDSQKAEEARRNRSGKDAAQKRNDIHDYRDDVNDYDDPGDFADDFEDEFGSWDDAYDFWEDND